MLLFTSVHQSTKKIKNLREQKKELRQKLFDLEEKLSSLEAEVQILREENERISEERDRFEYEALHDQLTKVSNRAFLIEKIQFLLNLCKRVPSMKFYILLIDLMHFKNINDYLGHTIGDRLLALVARRIKRAVGVEDMVARLGGDEFAVIISDPLSIEKVNQISLDIYESISSKPFLVRKHKIEMKLHIGLAAYDPSHMEPEDILRDVDIALHYARENNLPVAFFDEKLKNQFLESAQIERDLQFALKEKQFILFYQPIISLKNSSLVGFEALLRWVHPSKGFIPPSKFIPIAEETGLIIPMTGWILTEACRQIAKWEKIKPVTVSVNVSGKHFAMESLPDEVAGILHETGANPLSLKLEVTETSAMENPEKSMRILSQLNKLGVRLSIDDFGNGYSNLSQLYRLPFDTLKIDRSFVSAINEKGEVPEILKLIILLGKNLGMSLIAEGIETRCQLECLRALECDYGQGYLIAKPMPKEEAERFLLNSDNLFSQFFLLGEN